MIILFIFLFYNSSGLYISPLSAHKFAEESSHYGPSDIKHIQDFDNVKYFLCQYDKWVSCDPIKKSLFVFWGIGGTATGFEYNESEAFDYTWVSNREEFYLYGKVNDSRIVKIEVILHSGNVLSQTTFYDNLFLIILNNNDYPTKVNGYDTNENIIFTK